MTTTTLLTDPASRTYVIGTLLGAHALLLAFARKQPFRTITFGIGVLFTFGMVFHVLCAAI
jgi:hypothetical protein